MFEPWGEPQKSELHDMMMVACEAGQYSIRGYAKGIGPGVDIPGPGYHVGSSDPVSFKHKQMRCEKMAD